MKYLALALALLLAVGSHAAPATDVFEEFRQFLPESRNLIDNVRSQIPDEDLRTLEEEVSNLRASTDVQIENLRETLKNHVQQYIGEVQTFLGSDETARFKDLLKVATISLKEKFDRNVEETKDALLPIFDKIQTKVTGWVQKGKELAAPYIEEYKDQLKF